MKFVFPLALSLAFGALVVPAHAQMLGGMGGAGGGPKVPDKGEAPNLAPAGLPGVGASAPIANGPKLQKPSSGDPTQDLFAAINDNNYANAQDAVSRGADLRAVDQFGETPLDLAIALNRTNITFMLLGTRNELASQGAGGGTMGAPWSLGAASKQARREKAYRQSAPFVPVRETPRVIIPAGEPGTPDPQAGFLGFGSKG